MRIPHWIVILLLLCGLAATSLDAATYKLIDGRTVIGEPLLPTASDAGVKLRVGDGTYENVAWGRFSQEDLKTFAENQRLTQFVEPFIEVTPEEKAKLTEVIIKPVERLSRPEGGSVLGSLFGSGIGWLTVLLLFGGNIFAGYEIAIYRGRNIALVTGLAAIPFLGFVSNIVWLCIPTYIEPVPEPTEEELAVAAAQAPAFQVPVAGQMPGEAAAAAAATAAAAPAAPAEEVFTRGQFTFNRRFFETRFAGFFAVIRRGADKHRVLVFKTGRAELVADRITRITANDMHIRVIQGGAGEMGITFKEIQEARIRQQA